MSDGPPDRTYDDEEVDEIFSRAAEAEDALPPAAGRRAGLTLAELQEVGREVGLAPERVAAAAAVVDARPADPPGGTFLGGPRRVARSVQLPRALTEREWEMVTSELRQTFGSPGRVTSRPSVPEWTDGEVHAVLEPTATGARLRLEARRFPLTVGAAAGAFGIFAGLFSLLTSALDEATFGPLLEWMLPALLVLVGAGAIGLHVLRLRQWAEDREERLAHVGRRAKALLDAGPADDA